MLFGVILVAACEVFPAPDEWPESANSPVPDVLVDGLDDPAGLVYFGSGFAVAERGAGAVRLFDADFVEAEPLASDLAGPSQLLVVGEHLVVSTDDVPGLSVVEMDGSVTPLWGGDASVVDLATDGEGLWFVLGGTDSSPAGLRWMELGGDGHSVLSEDLEDPTGIAWADGGVFVADPGRGELLRFDELTGVDSAVASPDEDPRDVAADGGDLFFAARSERWPGGGWIYSVSNDGFDLDPLSYSPPGLDRVELDEDYVYWTSAQSIARAPRDGGTYEVLAAETRVADFLVLDDRLVWTDRDRGQVLAVALND